RRRRMLLRIPTDDRAGGSWNMPQRGVEPSARSGASRCEGSLVEDDMYDQSRNESGAPSESGAPEEVNTTRARQGVTGHNVRYVLAFGIAGVVIVFALAYFGVFGA